MCRLCRPSIRIFASSARCTRSGVRIAKQTTSRGWIIVWSCFGVCQELTRQYSEPHFYFSYRSEVPELLKAARSYNTDYDSALEKWKTVPNLYIDDLFKLAGPVKDGKLLDIEREELRLMFDLINARYINHLTTIFSSEFPIKDITAIDAALGSRIYEMINPYGLYVTGRNQRIGGKQ